MKMQWKSRKEIRAKVHTNQHTGEEIYTLIGKDEKPRARDVIKKTTIEVIREVEMIGPELVLKYGECKERLSFMGYGSSQPVFTDEQIDQMATEKEKEKAHQSNRRTAYKIITK